MAALLYPTWSARAFRERVASAIADVEAVGQAARRSRELQRRWPVPAPPGEAPPELSQLGGTEGPFSRPGYTVGWTTWQVVDSVAAPPEPDPLPAPGDAPRISTPRRVPVTRTVGAVMLQSGEEALLAELLRHYGGGTSFVLDTIWLLVLPERAERALGTGFSTL